MLRDSYFELSFQSGNSTTVLQLKVENERVLILVVTWARLDAINYRATNYIIHVSAHQRKTYFRGNVLCQRKPTDFIHNVYAYEYTPNYTIAHK